MNGVVSIDNKRVYNQRNYLYISFLVPVTEDKD